MITRQTYLKSFLQFLKIRLWNKNEWCHKVEKIASFLIEVT